MKPKHYYHCSSKWLGAEFQPLRVVPKTVSKREPPTPRLCVCRTMAACFAARMFDHHRPVFVYRTAKPYRSINPKDVWDSIVTGERWLIPPVKLIHVATINALNVDRIQEAALQYHIMTGQASSLLNRLAQYAIARDVLDGPEWEERLINRWLKKFEIVNPTRFLAERAAKRMRAD